MKSSSVLTIASIFVLARQGMAGAPTAMRLGINLDSLTDWSPQQMFVDLMKTARVPFGTVQDPWDDRGIPVDEDGWPLGDFGVILSTSAIDAGQTYRPQF